jgi:predicted NAD-dependent protein-ADP-ribosyltransferase YbiA (DUF1768 family)
VLSASYFPRNQRLRGFPDHYARPKIPGALVDAGAEERRANLGNPAARSRPGEVILSKRNELGLLSNFAPTPFTFRGKRYASLEGFWQMMKYPEDTNDLRATFPDLEWKLTREQVGQLTAFDAKHAGSAADANMKKMGITWITFEGKRMEPRSATPGEYYKLIVEATREKVRQNPEVQKVLLATGDLILKPDHHQEPDAPAAWRYYEILTTIRTELQKKQEPFTPVETSQPAPFPR